MSLFALNEDQCAVQQTARSFADERIAPHAIDWDQAKHFAVDVIREAAALGLCGIYVREDIGGSGLTRLDGVVVMEELATACPSTAAYISIHNMVTGMVDHYGDERQRNAYGPRLCRGELLGSYCLTEPSSGSDAAALRTRAVLEGEHYVLNGTKQFISGAGATDLYVVMARSGGAGPGGISAFLVERDAPGLSFGAEEKKMGWHTQPTRQVILEDCRIPRANLLGAEGSGFKMVAASISPPARSAARVRRLTRQSPIWPNGAPSTGGWTNSRRCNSASQTWRPAWKWPAPSCGALPPLWTRVIRARPSSAPWLSASSPMPASRLPTRRCNCMGAMATSPITVWRKSCVICACIRYWKAQMRSCASSSRAA
jgi:hypothetical protein